MAESAILKYEVREKASKPERKKFLNEGYVLGVIFGKGMESVPVAVNKSDFRSVVKDFGRNAVIKMQGPDDVEYNVMVKNVDLTPMTYEYHHVDFQQVSLTEVMEASVTIRFVGTEFIGAKGLIVNPQMDEITVSALPHNIPDVIEVDVTHCEDGDSILIKDLKLPSDVTTNMDEEELVATVNIPRMEEEADEDEAEVDVEVEIIGEDSVEDDAEEE